MTARDYLGTWKREASSRRRTHPPGSVVNCGISEAPLQLPRFQSSRTRQGFPAQADIPATILTPNETKQPSRYDVPTAMVGVIFVT